MTILLKDAGKRFNRDWIFRHLDFAFHSPSKYVVLGGNGSGKSTLLKTILGFSPLSEGRMECTIDGKHIAQEKLYREFSFCSPYMELYEELSLSELVEFHTNLKPLRSGLTTKEFVDVLELSHASNKPVKFFSSGMKQRVRLGLAILSETSVVLLDEPVSNLDKKAVQWYKTLVEEEMKNRLIVVASNHTEDEFFFCTEIINIEDFKNR